MTSLLIVHIPPFIHSYITLSFEVRLLHSDLKRKGYHPEALQDTSTTRRTSRTIKNKDQHLLSKRALTFVVVAYLVYLSRKICGKFCVKMIGSRLQVSPPALPKCTNHLLHHSCFYEKCEGIKQVVLTKLQPTRREALWKHIRAGQTSA